MKYLANTMNPDNKAKATVLVDDLRKYSKAADAPAAAANGNSDSKESSINSPNVVVNDDVGRVAVRDADDGTVRR